MNDTQMRRHIKETLYTNNDYGIIYQDPAAKLDDEQVTWLENRYEINVDAHRMCVNCQARQFIKYEETPPPVAKDDKPFSYKNFYVKCGFVAKGLPPGSKDRVRRISAANDIPEEDAIRMLRAAIDPVSWAELFFDFRDGDEDWHLRNYQKEQLRCTAKRMVIREGRRSGKTFAVALKLLYMAFNKRVRKGTDPSTGKPVYTGPEIMIVTPFQAQVSNIFNEMEKILKRNKTGDLIAEVKTGTGGNLYVKTPFYRMELTNGAKIAGFVSGVGIASDGSSGGTMRGQNADIIYMDEMDMIPEEVLDKVILPITLTRRNVIVIATSTPIGKRGHFFRWCLSTPNFKEDYLPSSVLPHWEEEAAAIRAENTEESFNSEYMGQFIDGNLGVFKASLVYDARKDYSYLRDTHRMSPWWRKVVGVREFSQVKTSIGIDWNKNAGTEYVVTVYDPGTGWWIVAETVNVPHSDFSSVAWQEEVIRLNFKWKPDYIYADQGYGHTIIEDLLLLAHGLKKKKRRTPEEEQTVQLTDRLIAFDFRKKIPLRSPATGKVFEKEGKQFLVENAVRVFESRRIWFAESDRVMLDQLLNYRILRHHASTGKPVYGPESVRMGDHRLDALMLALGGLAIQYSIYSRAAQIASEPGLIPRNSGVNFEGLRYGPDEAADIRAQIAKAVGGGDGPSMLAIVRGGGREQDLEIKRKYLAQRGGVTPDTRREPRSMNFDKGSVFHQLWKQANRGDRGYEFDEEMLNSEESSGSVRRRVNRRKGGVRRRGK